MIIMKITAHAAYHLAEMKEISIEKAKTIIDSYNAGVRKLTTSGIEYSKI